MQFCTFTCEICSSSFKFSSVWESRLLAVKWDGESNWKFLREQQPLEQRCHERSLATSFTGEDKTWVTCGVWKAWPKTIRTSKLKLTTASSWVEGGCPACPGTFTVTSQPLDNKTLPMASNPRNPAMSPHTGTSGHSSRCDNSGKRKKRRGSGREAGK